MLHAAGGVTLVSLRPVRLEDDVLGVETFIARLSQLCVRRAQEDDELLPGEASFTQLTQCEARRPELLAGAPAALELTGTIPVCMRICMRASVYADVRGHVQHVVHVHVHVHVHMCMCTCACAARCACVRRVWRTRRP